MTRTNPYDATAVEQAIRDAQAEFAAGNVERSLKRLSAARDRHPDHAAAHQALASLLLAVGETSAAEANLRRAVIDHPDDVELWALLGSSQLATGRFADAAQSCRRSVDLGTQAPASWFGNLGVASLHMGDLAGAETAFRHALDLQPDRADLASNLGLTLLRRGELDEASTWLARAVQRAPERLEFRLNQINGLAGARRYQDALEHIVRAKRLAPDDPDLEYLAGLFHLSLGRFELGWPQYEARLRNGQTGLERLPAAESRLSKTELSTLNGKRLLVVAEQGAGDTIQFARFVPQLEAWGATLSFAVPESLYELLSQLAGPQIDIVRRDQAWPDFDRWVLLASVPGLFGLWPTREAQRPYLIADSPRGTRELEPSRGESRTDPNPLCVGLVWAGNPDYADDHARSLHISELGALKDLRGVRFRSLQLGARALAHEPAPEGFDIEDAAPTLRTYADTARRLSELDLLISVDTSVAHLAGALGVPTWLLLPFNADWRWQIHGESTPWYPQHRLFRQREPGAWEQVVAEVAEALRAKRGHTQSSS